MSNVQRAKLKVISMFDEGLISREKAAQVLGLSERQITRIRKEYIRFGDESVIHNNTSRKPANTISDDYRKKIPEYFNLPEYEGVNYTHFQEILRDEYGIKVSYSTLHRVLGGAGKESPLKKRQPKRRTPRKRKAHPGELIQIDATPYEWFGGETKYALHGAIDDATGEPVGLYMTDNECMFGYFEVMRQCVQDFGTPQSLYSDQHTIFRSPKTDNLSVTELVDGKTVNLTQFGRAMHELGVNIIYAKSPQAKGRIERLWETLQSRLPVEFKRRGIQTVADANEFLREYRYTYGKRFGVAAEGASMFVAFPQGDSLDNYLCIKHQRRVDNTCVFSFANKAFKIDTKGYPMISRGSIITVYVSPDFGIRAEYGGMLFDTIRYIKPIKSIEKKISSSAEKKLNSTVSPHLKHGSDEWKNIWWAESYSQTLKFLFDLFFKDIQRNDKKYDQNKRRMVGP